MNLLIWEKMHQLEPLDPAALPLCPRRWAVSSVEMVGISSPALNILQAMLHQIRLLNTSDTNGKSDAG